MCYRYGCVGMGGIPCPALAGAADCCIKSYTQRCSSLASYIHTVLVARQIIPSATLLAAPKTHRTHPPFVATIPFHNGKPALTPCIDKGKKNHTSLHLYKSTNLIPTYKKPHILHTHTHTHTLTCSTSLPALFRRSTETSNQKAQKKRRKKKKKRHAYILTRSSPVSSLPHSVPAVPPSLYVFSFIQHNPPSHSHFLQRLERHLRSLLESLPSMPSRHRLERMLRDVRPARQVAAHLSGSTQL